MLPCHTSVQKQTRVCKRAIAWETVLYARGDVSGVKSHFTVFLARFLPFCPFLFALHWVRWGRAVPEPCSG